MSETIIKRHPEHKAEKARKQANTISIHIKKDVRQRGERQQIKSCGKLCQNYQF